MKKKTIFLHTKMLLERDYLLGLGVSAGALRFWKKKAVVVKFLEPLVEDSWWFADENLKDGKE